MFFSIAQGVQKLIRFDWPRNYINLISFTGASFERLRTKMLAFASSKSPSSLGPGFALVSSAGVVEGATAGGAGSAGIG